MKKWIGLCFIGVGLGAVLAVGWSLSWHRESPTPVRPTVLAAADDSTVVIGSGLDLTSSETVEDWVRNADLVVDAEVVSEQVAEPSPVEVERGEGLVGRTVTLSVEKELWSQDGTQRLPALAELEASGWVFNDEEYEGRREFAIEHASRLEVGHRYVMALTFRPAVTAEMVERCGGGDPVVDAHWAIIGQSGTIPHDGSVLGDGEFEGSPITAKNWPRGAETSTGQSFRDSMIGSEVADVVVALRKVATRVEPAADPVPECLRADY